MNPAKRFLSYFFLLFFSAAALLLFFALREDKVPSLTGADTPSAVLAASLSGDMCPFPAPANSEAFEESPTRGGELPPVRLVSDPYPTFNGLALDAANNRVVMSDENRKSVLVYDRTAGNNSAAAASPLRQVIGPQSEIGYIAGIGLDPAHREMYAVNNDLDDRIVVFDYNAQGDLKPKRRLYVPHQSWGISLNPAADQFAVSVQQLSMIAIFRREAKDLEAPVRLIKGPATGIADPHGIHWDTANREIAVANHGNYSVITSYSADDAAVPNRPLSPGGHFWPSSITVFQDSASGNAKPLRTIEGEHTQLNWPMGLDVDTANNEIAVANNGDNSILIFSRKAQGDAAPLRIIRGPHTGITSPMGIAIDSKNNELWVANYGDHTALVFSRTAADDAVPKRIIRNAPAGTPTGGFGNPYAVAYDSKRDQLLVPN